MQKGVDHVYRYLSTRQRRWTTAKRRKLFEGVGGGARKIYGDKNGGNFLAGVESKEPIGRPPPHRRHHHHRRMPAVETTEENT